MEALATDGIDGQQLWGFLAALGLLSLLDEDAREERYKAPRLSFRQDGVSVIHSHVSREDLSSIVLVRLREFQAYLEQKWLKPVKKPSDFSRASYEELARESESGRLDFLAGLACVVGDEACESTLCAANGASHQNLLQSMRDILNLVEEEHLRLALFEPWRRSYRVPDEKRRQLNLGTRKPTLRFDPADERLYALRFSNPTTADDFCTEIGAQALAIPAFALLPVVPSMRPVTVSSSRNRQRVAFSWPLWFLPATLRSVRSLIWQGVRDPRVQRAQGVFAAFSADRVSGAKGKLSFAPAQGLW